MTMRPLFYALVLLLAGFHDGAFAQPYEQVRGVIHLDSSISGGEYEPEDLVQLLRKNKLQIAIFTDQATTRVEYGFFPVRWIMGWFTGWAAAKATGRTGSVETFGAVNYLDLLAAIDTKYPDTIVIPGVESFPFYYWQGSPLSGNLTMVNGYKHLLAVGMPATEDYEGLPSMSNGFFRGFGLESLLSLWPLVLLFLGYKCRKRSHSADWPLLFTLPAFLFLGTGILFLLHNFPFQFGKYDQYHGDQGLAPYQDFINYVEDRGGLVFWAHPEISKDQVIKKGP
ncbi:MAG: hypothetical protein O2954_15450, partial [bacterium]|nr:hypothetical protein [bacterium]